MLPSFLRANIFMLLSVFNQDSKSFAVISSEHKYIRNSLQLCDKKVVFSINNFSEFNANLDKEFSKVDMVLFFGLSKYALTEVNSAFQFLSTRTKSILWSLHDINDEHGGCTEMPSQIYSVVEHYLPYYSSFYRTMLWDYTESLPSKFISSLILSSQVPTPLEHRSQPLDVVHPSSVNDKVVVEINKNTSNDFGRLLRLSLFTLRLINQFTTATFASRVRSGINNILKYKDRLL